VRAAFAQVVTDSCLHLANNHESWRLGDVTVTSKSYSGVNLQRDERTVAALEAAVAKSGVATVEASIIMADVDNLPSFEKFSKLLMDSLAKTAYVGSNDFEERETDEIPKSQEIITIFDDLERICVVKGTNKALQDAQQNAVKVYVPCQIKFTLIAVLPGNRTDPPSMKYCKSEDITRLLCSTVWLSQEAGRSMWELEKIIDLHKMTEVESNKRFQLFKKCHSRGTYSLTYLLTYSLLLTHSLTH
jgi:hypothetical protein